MKRNFISINIPGSLAGSFFWSEALASLPDAKPGAAMIKIKRRPLIRFSVKPGKGRTFIGGTLIFLALMISCANPRKDGGETDSAKGTLAAQLWTFRYDLQKDVPGTLKKIKNLGIDYVEGFDASYIVGNPDEFKSQLDAAGLKMFALHWNNLNDWRKDPTVIIETAR